MSATHGRMQDVRILSTILLYHVISLHSAHVMVAVWKWFGIRNHVSISIHILSYRSCQPWVHWFEQRFNNLPPIIGSSQSSTLQIEKILIRNSRYLGFPPRSTNLIPPTAIWAYAIASSEAVFATCSFSPISIVPTDFGINHPHSYELKGPNLRLSI